MDMLTWDNMDDFDDNILLGNFALEIPSMDELMDIPTQQLIKPDHELSRYGKPLSDKEMDLKIRSRIPKNTNKANEWALKVYEQWASFRRDQMDTLLSDVTLPLHLTDGTSNSYTMGCPPVRGDNPRALASGLSYVQVDKYGITILYHLHQCRPCTSSDISC